MQGTKGLETDTNQLICRKNMLLSKGFEVEMYTGTAQGDIVGFSDMIVAA
jgi:hypothetical protein